jgi:hypothetical protein
VLFSQQREQLDREAVARTRQVVGGGRIGLTETLQPCRVQGKIADQVPEAVEKAPLSLRQPGVRLSQRGRIRFQTESSSLIPEDPQAAHHVGQRPAQLRGRQPGDEDVHPALAQRLGGRQRLLLINGQPREEIDDRLAGRLQRHRCGGRSRLRPRRRAGPDHAHCGEREYWSGHAPRSQQMDHRRPSALE